MINWKKGISVSKEFALELWRDESGGSLGRLALTLGGAAIGFAIGGPAGAAAFGMQLGALAGTLVGSLLFPAELPDQIGARLDPNNLTTASYGDPIPIGYGRFITGGVMAYYPGFVEHRIEEEVDGKSSQKQISYTYTGSFRVNLCEGPVDSIMKIWMNRKLVYDASTATAPFLDYEKINESPGTQGLRIYLGGEDQLPDATEVADMGVDATPAYRGLAGIFFENWPLDETGGVPPQITALIASEATETLASESFLSTSLGAYWVELNGIDRWAFSGGGLWDNAAQRQYGTHPSSGMIFPLIDSQNNFWSMTRQRSLTKYDAVTFASFGSQTQNDPANGGSWGDNNLWMDGGTAFGGVRTPEGKIIGERLWISEVATDLFFTPWVVIDIDNYLDSDGVGGGVINVGGGSEVGNTELSDFIVVDNERYLWIFDRLQQIFSRINPGDGLVDFFVDVSDMGADSFSNGHMITYDAHTDTIIFVTSTHMRKFDVSSQSFTEVRAWISGEPVPIVDAKNLTNMRQGVQADGTIYLQHSAVLGNFGQYDLRNFDAEQSPRSYSPALDFGFGSSTSHRGLWDRSRNAKVLRGDLGEGVLYCYIGRTGGGDLITVKSIVDDVSERIGLLPADIDTTELTEELHGYIINRRMPAKGALMPLTQLFFFNPVAEDFQIKFIKSGKSSILTIEEDDLGAAAGGQARVETDLLVEQYVQEIELPEVMELGYSNEETEYQPMWQRSKRPRSTTNTKRQKRISFPGTFVSNTDAKRRNDTMLYNIWTKRRPVTWTTSQRYMRLSPTDVITLTHEGAESNVVIGALDMGANNVLEFKGAADDPRNLISAGTGNEGDTGHDDQFIEIHGPSEFYVMDIPLLLASDSGYGAYLAAAPFSFGTDFAGTNFIQSLDSITYGSFGFVNSNRASTHGFASNTLAGGVDDGLWDRTNTLSVQILYGTLASATEDAVLDGANMLLVGSEIICFVTAVDNGNGSYTLSQLLRGRRGTEQEIDNHVASERVIGLNVNTTVRRGMDLSQLNIPLFYKGVTVGGSENSALVKRITVAGKSEWGWAPVHISGSISADDWSVNWTRRSTLTPEWRNLTGSPGIVVNNWEVDILDGPGGAVVRTITDTASANGSVVNITGDSFFYDDADQTTDLSGPVTTLDFIIYPMTNDIGRGFPATKQLIEG